MSWGPLPAVSPIADVLALWGTNGWLTPPLEAVVASGSVTIGRASTVTLVAAAAGPGLTPLYDVLSTDLTGRMVVYSAPSVGGAVFGEIMATAAQTQGACGVLVHGAVRDVPEISATGLPVYASATCVVGPNGSAHVTAVAEPVQIGDVPIVDGDYIVCDSSGCVRIAASSIDAVLDAARLYEDAETEVLRALGRGEPMTAAYRHKKTVVDELRQR